MIYVPLLIQEMCKLLINRVSCFYAAWRAFSSEQKLLGSAAVKFAELKNRGLVRLTGPDTLNFLQGLITNDTNHLLGANSMYALALNIQGRVVHDLIIHNCTTDTNPATDVIIECDESNYGELAHTLSKYRMRKKVDIVRVSDSLAVTAIFPGCTSEDLLKSEIQSLRLMSARLPEVRWHSHVLSWILDPRLSRLGGRLILPKGESPEPYLVEGSQAAEEDYHEVRYALGVPEGIPDIIPGKSLPLESNGDYLNGISFHKGCYIGQELTARAHHTGVVRKRLMPLRFFPFQNNKLAEIQPDSNILNDTGESIGKFRARAGLFGLGLLRIDQATKSKSLKIQVGETDYVDVETYRPFWWGNAG